jgi:hypothetical protein
LNRVFYVYFSNILLKEVIINTIKDRDIYYHYKFLLGTHGSNRAIVLTSILFNKDEDKVKKICEEGEKEYNEKI